MKHFRERERERALVYTYNLVWVNQAGAWLWEISLSPIWGGLHFFSVVYGTWMIICTATGVDLIIIIFSMLWGVLWRHLKTLYEYFYVVKVIWHGHMKFKMAIVSQTSWIESSTFFALSFVIIWFSYLLCVVMLVHANIHGLYFTIVVCFISKFHVQYCRWGWACFSWYFFACMSKIKRTPWLIYNQRAQKLE